MVNQQQQKEMLDYLVSKLQGSYDSVIPNRKEIVSGIETSYIKLGNDHVVLLIDHKYPQKRFERHIGDSRLKELYSRAKKQFSNIGSNIGFVFYLDGKTFFRNAEPRKDYDRAMISRLRDLNPNILENVAQFRPEEIFVFEKRLGRLQYYSGTDMGMNALLTFNFHRLAADYGRRQTGAGYTLATHSYLQDHAWSSRQEHTGQLVLQNGLLVPKTLENH